MEISIIKESEIDELGERQISNEPIVIAEDSVLLANFVTLKLSDKKALPILEKIYNHYLEYLNMLITEAELYDKVLACGIFLITEKSELDGNSTYRNYIIDAIYRMTPEELEKGAKYEVR